VSYNNPSGKSVMFGREHTSTLDSVCSRSFMKIYCNCGRIVDLDKKEMKLKLSLKKNTECTFCRNIRISRDIEGMNEHFDGIESDG